MNSDSEPRDELGLLMPAHEIAPALSDAVPASLPPDVIVAVSAIQFCDTCGEQWRPDWDACQRCEAKSKASNGATAQSEYRREFGRIKSSLFLYFALLTVCIGGAVVAIAQEGEFGVHAEMVSGALISLIATIWAVRERANMLPLLRETGHIGWYVLAPILAVGSFILATSAVSMMHRFFGLQVLDYLDTFTAGGYGFPWAVLVICVQPAIFEELAFRGVIASSLSAVLGRYETVFVTALLFAILHLSAPSLPHLFVLGVILGILRLRTGSLYPGMLLHFCHNLLVISHERFGDTFAW